MRKKRHLTVENSSPELAVRISATPGVSDLLLLFLVVVSLFGAIFLICVGRPRLPESDASIAAFAGLSLGVLSVLWAAAWDIFSTETILVTASSLTVTQRLGPIRFASVYALEDVGEFRPATRLESSVASGFTLQRKHVRFDYRGRTLCLGAELSPSDAAELARLLTSRSSELLNASRSRLTGP